MAHSIRRPDHLSFFGLQDDPPVVTDHDRVALDEADRLTDTTMAMVFGRIDDAERRALVDTAEALAANL